MTEPGVIDLNAKRAARREAIGTELRIMLGEGTFTLPTEVPIEALDPLRPVIQTVLLIAQNPDPGKQLQNYVLARPEELDKTISAIKQGLAILFGDEQWPQFVAQRPSPQDILELFRGLATAYAVGLGEALAPPKSSSGGGATLKPISNRTTKSTRAGSSRKTRQHG